MKKSRLYKLSVLLLVLLLITSLVNTTFSWFSRPNELTGKALNLTDSYNTSVNSEALSFETYELSSDGAESGPLTSISPIGAVSAGDRVLYRTDIYNYGADPQSVSLYIASLENATSHDGLTLGVNNPTKSFKKFYEHSDGTKTNNNTMRVYFKPNGIWSEDDFVVCHDNIW